MNRPLEGLKILDFSWAAAGPVVTSVMACYGAEVIKVETHKNIDNTRTLMPFVGGIQTPDRASGFLSVNAGKYSITLNLKTPKGKEIAGRLIKRSDILVENFTSGTMPELGLGYEDCKKIKPDIIYLSSNMYGHTGPYANRGGFGGTLLSASGLMHLTGWPDGLPKEPGYVYTDFVAPKFALLGLLAALDFRRKTSKGQYIDLSQMETIPFFQSPINLDYQANGRDSMRIGNRSTYAAPHGVYRCQGRHRYCVITVFSDDKWRKFCQVIGQPSLAEDPEFRTVLNRLKNVDKVDKLVEDWTMLHSTEEVMNLMQAAGIAAGVVQNGQDLDNDPQLKDYYWNLDYPELGILPYRGMPVKASGFDYEVKRCPRLGEHNDYVYTELLGISDTEFAQLLEEGIFE
jgi:benzylsuccinate CoA-transferase BbsF subunit